jgi:hypothetical protein
MIGDPRLDGNGVPITELRQGVPMLVRDAPLVNASSNSTNTAGIARKSRLTEIMFGEELLAGAAARTAHPSPPGTAPNHATLLNAAEKRLLAEWMDLGGQYYNDPFNGSSGVRTITGLSVATFESQVYPILNNACASCHQAGLSPGENFRGNRYVLTGDAEGDFNVTLTMINNACNAAANPLLARPSTAPHPAGATGQTTPLLPPGSASYNAIANWIATGCSP